MKTLSAMRNDWRCPKCGDQTTTDKAGRGFVRHLRNSFCDFEKGGKDDNLYSQKIEIKREDTYKNRMRFAVTEVTRELQRHPEWRSHIRSKLSFALYGNDYGNDPIADLPDKLEEQRILACEYLALVLTIEQIQYYEYYLRRFPFRRLPVKRSDHIQNVCELYFSKFYQFKERMNRYLKSLNTHASNIDVGHIVREYKKIFEREIRTRNNIHHREFSDRTIELVYLHDMLDIGERNFHYRETTGYWIKQIQGTVMTLENIVEALARLTLENVPLLSKYNKPVDDVQITLSPIAKNVVETS